MLSVVVKTALKRSLPDGQGENSDTELKGWQGNLSQFDCRREKPSNGALTDRQYLPQEIDWQSIHVKALRWGGQWGGPEQASGSS